jgi:glutamine synthetase
MGKEFSGFVEKHGLRTSTQSEQASELRRKLEREPLQFVRMAWADPHGASRAKAVALPAFLGALTEGYNINVATTTLDSANARTFSSFTRGGGMGLDEMTGSPNLTIVPDPSTFRILPWAPGVGWVLCDEYFKSGVPFHFSPRHLLRNQLQRLKKRGMGCMLGLEIEWYLLRLAENTLGDEHIGSPGVRGRPVGTSPVEPGYSYHSESNMDLMQPVLTALAQAFDKTDLPLRSVENEWGPGQVECTFAPSEALKAADNLMFFRTATKQICRRMGYFATFMCRPGLKGYYSSGWHLHQSLIDTAGNNVFIPETATECLSPLGRSFLGGVLRYAAPSAAFTTPTVNGYRRLQPNSLAPDRATWCPDHRGAMVRVLGAPGDTATRLENRVGEPAANPYLYAASQIIAGLAGVDGSIEPGPPNDEPYAADRPLLPKSLMEALDALEREPLFRTEFGDVFIDYFLKLKRNETGRFLSWLADQGLSDAGNHTTVWEQNEYFDFF